MLNLVQRWIVISFLSLALAVPAIAANNVFMSITGPRGPIQGDAKSPHGSQWIPVLEFDESVVAPRDAATGQATGKRQHPPVKVVKQIDAASPQLQKAAATGEHLKEVVFQLYRNNAGKEELYETVRLTDAIISSFQNRGSSSVHSGHPTEEISLEYSKIEITYTQQKPNPITKSPAAKPSN